MSARPGVRAKRGIADARPLVYSYVHLICSVWHPELQFSSAQHLSTVEGLQLIPAKRRGVVSSLCAH